MLHWRFLKAATQQWEFKCALRQLAHWKIIFDDAEVDYVQKAAIVWKIKADFHVCQPAASLATKNATPISYGRLNRPRPLIVLKYPFYHYKNNFFNTGRGQTGPFTKAVACLASAPATRSKWISLWAQRWSPCDEGGSCTSRTFYCLCTRNSSPCIASWARPFASCRRLEASALTALAGAALLGWPTAVSLPKGAGTDRERCIFAAVRRLSAPQTTPASWRNS